MTTLNVIVKYDFGYCCRLKLYHDDFLQVIHVGFALDVNVHIF